MQVSPIFAAVWKTMRRCLNGPVGFALAAALLVVSTYQLVSKPATAQAITYALSGKAAKSATAAAIPGAPQNLQASAGNGQNFLGWNAPSSNGGATITSYRVFRGTTNSNQQIVTSGGCANLSAVLACTDTGLTNGQTYYYIVSAVNSAGQGAPSNQVTATPTAPATIPGAPQNLQASASNGQNFLGWQAPASNGGATITSYRVFRSTNGSGSAIITSGGCANLGAVFACTDTGLNNGQAYTYFVSAVNSVGQGAGSSPVTATPVGPTIPGAPQNLAWQAGNGQIFLGWNAPASNGGATITSYRVFRGTTSSNQVIVTSGGCANLGAVLACTDTGLTNGQAYSYFVSAVNSVGQGAGSNQVTATPVGPTIPGAPQNLQASADNGQIFLGWQAPASNGGAAITRYRVFRSTNGSGSALVTSGGCANLGVIFACTDTGLNNGQAYTYFVSADNSVGTGAPSNTVTATPVGPTVPGAPQNLQTSAGNAQNFLGWQAPASNGGATITRYRVFRSTNGSAAALVTSGGCANLGVIFACTDTGLNNGQAYTYFVSADNSVGTGFPSNQVTATPTGPTLPGAPLNLAWQAGNGQIFLGWQAPASNGGATITSYRVFRGTTNSNQQIVTSGGCANLSAVLACTDTGLNNGQTYYYTVSAVNSAGQGAPSSQVTATPNGTPAFSITTTSLNPATATVGVGYGAQQAVAATGGQNPYSWSASGLPNGMGINPSSGAVFGTPTVAGPFNFTVTVRDSSSPQKTASKTLSLTVIATSGLVANAGPDQTVRLPATVTLNGSGSTSVLTYAWSFIGKPSGSTATLNNLNTASPNFTPDVPGLYSIKLMITSSGGSAEDTVLVRAETANCTSSALRVYPVSLSAHTNQTQEIRGYGGSGNYTWSLVTNASGGSLSSTTGSSINYTAGSNTGQDVIRLMDVWCGSVEMTIPVVGDPPSTLPEVDRIDPIEQAANVSVIATFKNTTPVTRAEVCLDDNSKAPGQCTQMSVTDSGKQATVLLTSVSNGSHTLWVRGFNSRWGRLTSKTVQINSRIAILLLHGWSKSEGGDHSASWKDFTLNQLKTDFPGIEVKVVTGLDGWGTIEENLARLKTFICSDTTVSSIENYILIGHSMGGLISRAFATGVGQKTVSVCGSAQNVDLWKKVRAIITIDTPHRGADHYFLQFIAPVVQVSFQDKARGLFTPEGIKTFNEKYPPEKSPQTRIVPVASEAIGRLRAVCGGGPGSCVAIKDEDYETGSDDVIPVSSQLGVPWKGETFLPGPYQRKRIGGLLDTLHEAIKSDCSIWKELYCQRVRPTLEYELGPAAVPCSTSCQPSSLRLANASPSVVSIGNPVLPAAFPLQSILQASGKLTVSSPNNTVNFVVEQGSDLVISLTSDHINPNLTLNAPGGNTFTPASVNGLGGKYQVYQTETRITQAFLIHNPPAGNWSLSIAAPGPAGSPNISLLGGNWSLSAGVRSPIRTQVRNGLEINLPIPVIAGRLTL